MSIRSLRPRVTFLQEDGFFEYVVSIRPIDGIFYNFVCDGGLFLSQVDELS